MNTNTKSNIEPFKKIRNWWLELGEVIRDYLKNRN